MDLYQHVHIIALYRNTCTCWWRLEKAKQIDKIIKTSLSLTLNCKPTVLLCYAVTIFWIHVNKDSTDRSLCVVYLCPYVKVALVHTKIRIHIYNDGYP